MIRISRYESYHVPVPTDLIAICKWNFSGPFKKDKQDSNTIQVPF